MLCFLSVRWVALLALPLAGALSAYQPIQPAATQMTPNTA